MPGVRRLDASTLAAAAGVVGPACFVGGWLAAAALRPGYSSRTQAISQLAREGAPHRTVMTGAFVAFGVAMPVFAGPLVRALAGGRTLRLAVTVSGLATIAVAACPLSRSGGGTRDLVHGAFAVTGYVAMVAAAALGAHALRAEGRPALARASWVVAAVAAASLAATTLGRDVGLYQRLGLGAVDAWYAVASLSIVVATRSSTPRPGAARVTA
ncbi:MAG TPA: DUF998 domain-containing protein [Acidimicrobiales bacterium]|nr:DUF998 domain-containing protein [Acidimicrobiales bacterium]